ncbi:MAG: hypothetical protein PHU42_03585 [Patescibacteria group bacterium]|nr:hypothetical protein [Patescibacteria group bacterium]
MPDEQNQQPAGVEAERGGVETPTPLDVRKMNSFKHGLTANLLCELDIDCDFQNILQKLAEDFPPFDTLSEIYLEKVAINFIRMARVPKIEKNLINNIMTPPRLVQKFKSKEEERLYLQAEKIYELEVEEWKKDDDNCPVNLDFMGKPKKHLPPKPQAEAYYDFGEETKFNKDNLETIINFATRYGVALDNRFYKSAKELRDYWEAKKR